MKIETEGGKKVFTTNPDGPHSVFGFILEKSPRMPRGLEVSVKGRTFIHGISHSYSAICVEHFVLIIQKFKCLIFTLSTLCPDNNNDFSCVCLFIMFVVFSNWGSQIHRELQ